MKKKKIKVRKNLDKYADKDDTEIKIGYSVDMYGTCQSYAIRSCLTSVNANTILLVILAVPLFPKKHVSCELKAEQSLVPYF